jgi:hypothetical protein
MPLGKLSDRVDAQNAQIVSRRVLLRPGWSDLVFAFHDAEEIGPRIHVFSIRYWIFDVRHLMHQERNRPAGRVVATALCRRASNVSTHPGGYKTKRPAFAAGRFELIKLN